ncbi:DUF983 domain-containing protein [Sneathiella glossodoripedis]|uniref:DUF983 domain-containing protein n=1 Tax=Sneathiella glossodoripedis TaxID=418853 RepID=UPI0034E29421
MGISCKCPACGKGKLFSGQFDVLPVCAECSYDLKSLDSGDVSAVFIVFITSITLIAACFWVQFVFWPPVWLQLIIWIPMLIALPVLLLKPLKGVLLAIEYSRKHTAEEKTSKS